MERFRSNFWNELVNFGTHKRGDDSDVTTGVNDGVASSSS